MNKTKQIKLKIVTKSKTSLTNDSQNSSNSITPLNSPSSPSKSHSRNMLDSSQEQYNISCDQLLPYQVEQHLSILKHSLFFDNGCGIENIEESQSVLSNHFSQRLSTINQEEYSEDQSQFKKITPRNIQTASVKKCLNINHFGDMNDPNIYSTISQHNSQGGERSEYPLLSSWSSKKNQNSNKKNIEEGSTFLSQKKQKSMTKQESQIIFTQRSQLDSQKQYGSLNLNNITINSKNNTFKKVGCQKINAEIEYTCTPGQLQALTNFLKSQGINIIPKKQKNSQIKSRIVKVQHFQNLKEMQKTCQLKQTPKGIKLLIKEKYKNK